MSSSRIPIAPVPHMLSIDVEEFRGAEVVRKALEAGKAHLLPPERYDELTTRLLAMLGEHRVLATFFVLAPIARKSAALVREIAAQGHEVASHGMRHIPAYEMGRGAFRQDIRDSRALLEDTIGEPVLGFRAPSLAITPRSTWAFAELLDAGYHYSSSTAPMRHDIYGLPGCPRFPFIAASNGTARLLEIPVTTIGHGRFRTVVAGGGYFRLLPWAVTWAILKARQAQRRSSIVYLHPWEFDENIADVPIPRLARWRVSVNVHRQWDKFHSLLHSFPHVRIRDNIDTLAASATRWAA